LNVLKNLDEWDDELAHLLRDFVGTAQPVDKFVHWSAIVDHVAAPMRGRQPIAENNCGCAICQVDLAALTN
jgi:hypothetical protein